MNFVALVRGVIGIGERKCGKHISTVHSPYGIKLGQSRLYVTHLRQFVVVAIEDLSVGYQLPHVSHQAFASRVPVTTRQRTRADAVNQTEGTKGMGGVITLKPTRLLNSLKLSNSSAGSMPRRKSEKLSQLQQWHGTQRASPPISYFFCGHHTQKDTGKNGKENAAFQQKSKAPPALTRGASTNGRQTHSNALIFSCMVRRSIGFLIFW